MKIFSAILLLILSFNLSANDASLAFFNSVSVKGINAPLGATKINWGQMWGILPPLVSGFAWMIINEKSHIYQVNTMFYKAFWISLDWIKH